MYETGHHFHKKSGLVLTLYRAYDPNLGRWLSADPIGSERSKFNAVHLNTAAKDWYEQGYNLAEMLPTGTNLYNYLGNEPILKKDPQGEILPLLRKLGADAWKHRKRIKKACKNINIDGPAKRGSRLFQIRLKKKPVFRCDYGSFPGSGGKKKLHYHRPPNMKKHRPYEGW